VYAKARNNLLLVKFHKWSEFMHKPLPTVTPNAHVILNLNGTMCNKFYCKVLSYTTNEYQLYLQLVNKATCFGRFIRPSSGPQNNIVN